MTIAPSEPRRLTIVAHEIGAWANHRAATADRARAQGWQVTLLVGGEGDPVSFAAVTATTHDVLPMGRGKGGPGEVWRSVRVLRRAMQRSDTVELVTLKPIVLGLFSRRTIRPSRRPRVVATLAGLGTVLDEALPRRSHWLTITLRILLRDAAAVLVENPDDARGLVIQNVDASRASALEKLFDRSPMSHREWRTNPTRMVRVEAGRDASAIHPDR